jgi:hypothetical protein
MPREPMFGTAEVAAVALPWLTLSVLLVARLLDATVAGIGTALALPMIMSMTIDVVLVASVVAMALVDLVAIIRHLTSRPIGYSQ